MPGGAARPSAAPAWAVTSRSCLERAHGSVLVPPFQEAAAGGQRSRGVAEGPVPPRGFREGNSILGISWSGITQYIFCVALRSH